MAATLHYDADAAAQLVAIDTDWDSLVRTSGDAARMARVLALWDEHVPDPHLSRTLGRRMQRAGFQRVCVRVVPLLDPAFDPRRLQQSADRPDRVVRGEPRRGCVRDRRMGARSAGAPRCRRGRGS